MKIRYMATIGIALLFGLTISPVFAGNDIELGMMIFEKAFWGPVTLTIPIDNKRDDSAKINVEITLLFHEHYVSGLERFVTDTFFYIPPLHQQDHLVNFELPPSFGMVIIRVIVQREYVNPLPGDEYFEPVSQLFRSILKVPDGAADYMNRKYSVGPIYSVLDHQFINLDLGRIYMFEIARGTLLSEISDAFEVSNEYLRYIYRKLFDEGFFPDAVNKYTPGVMAVKEEEGQVIKRLLDSRALPMFRSWYESVIDPAMDQIMKDAGVVETARRLPSLKMAILLNLLGRDWINDKSGYKIMTFEDQQYDLSVYNRPFWIIEGGEFYVPPLCHAVFEENGELYMATFSPDPSLTYEKAAIFSMRREVEENEGAIPVVRAAQIGQIIDAFEKRGSPGKFGEELRLFIVTARPQIKKFRGYQVPYLTDYVIRYILGAYFLEHPANNDWIDCVRVEYGNQ